MYIAANVTTEHLTDGFDLGDGEQYGGYTNHPLSPGEHYNVGLRGSDTPIFTAVEDSVSESGIDFICCSHLTYSLPHLRIRNTACQLISAINLQFRLSVTGIFCWVWLNTLLGEPHTSMHGGTILLCVRTSVRSPYRICACAPNIRQHFAC